MSDLSDNALYNDFRHTYETFGPFVIEPRNYCGHDIAKQLKRLGQAGLISVNPVEWNGGWRAKITVFERPLRTLEQLYPEFGLRRFRERW